MDITTTVKIELNKLEISQAILFWLKENGKLDNVIDAPTVNFDAEFFDGATIQFEST